MAEKFSRKNGNHLTEKEQCINGLLFVKIPLYHISPTFITMRVEDRMYLHYEKTLLKL
jgi:hypothetical protein